MKENYKKENTIKSGWGSVSNFVKNLDTFRRPAGIYKYTYNA